MTTLNNIEAILNLEIGDKILKDGKKYNNKNQYYYYEQAYYIIKLTKDNWMIAEDCQKTRKLLKKHCWSTSTYGYVCTRVDKSTTKLWHQLLFKYEDGLMADHINNKRFDNRMDNIRIVTASENSRNRTINSNNTSGKQGVLYFIDKRNGLHYWRVKITDNNGKNIQKQFSIKKLGNEEAKRQAIEYRKQLEIQYGYIGD
jgi:hypothetical protein